MNSCAEIKESIGAWLDGELRADDAALVSAHVASCGACAEERRQLERLNVTLKSVLEAEAQESAPEPLWSQLRERIEAKRPWYAGLAEWAGPAFRAPSFAWAVPAVIVLLIGAFYIKPSLPDWGWGAPSNSFTAVESIDAFGRNVALLREYETKTTVIWLYQNPDSENEASGEVNDKGPAF